MFMLVSAQHANVRTRYLIHTMSHRAARCVRPYLFHSFKRSQCVAHTRAFTCTPIASQIKPSKDVTHDYEKRLAQLDAYKPRDDWYPRLPFHTQAERTPVELFQQEFAQLANDEIRDAKRTVTGTMSSSM